MDPTLSTIAFFLCAITALRATWQLSKGTFHRGYFNLIALGSTWLLLFATLVIRGRIQGGCPMGNLTDHLLYLSWGILGFYLIAGSTLRVSLLGYFTAPLTATLLGIALAPQIWQEAQPREVIHSAYIETHASLTMLSYAGFALASVAAVMFLILDHQLKSHKLQSLSWKLPPIHHLSSSILRLTLWSLLLLTAGLTFGFLEWKFYIDAKIAVAIILWLILAISSLLRITANISAKSYAIIVIAGFLLSLISIATIENSF